MTAPQIQMAVTPPVCVETYHVLGKHRDGRACETDTAQRYRQRASADQLAAAHASAGDPVLRERLQLALMRHPASRLAGIAAVAASDRYYETTHGGDWENDH